MIDFKKKFEGYLKARKITATAFRERIGRRKSLVTGWLNGRFPNWRDWPLIVREGIATKAELEAMRTEQPKRPKCFGINVRRIRMYTLAEYAARAQEQVGARVRMPVAQHMRQVS